MTTSTASTAVSADKRTNVWLASVYGGLFTAIILAGFGLLLQTNIPVLWILALLLIGVGPVLGYLTAAGRLGSDWKTLIGGIIGSLVPFLSQLILWPLLVWLFDRRHSFLWMWIGSIIGLILGVVVFFAIGFTMGQNPYLWWGPAWSLAAGVWGGSAAAGMAARE